MKPTYPGEERDKEYIEFIVDQVKAGSTQSFEILIHAFEKQIYRYCYCILKSREEAEDAVQDVFIKVYQDIQLYQRQVSFSAWLHKVAYHQCLDRIRKQSRWQRLILHYKEQQPAQYVKDTNPDIDQMLNQLNTEERNLLLLKVVEQYSFEEIGQIMDVKPATLRKKYERLRKKLIQQKNTEGGMKHGQVVKPG
ncbi:RNA polymerase subunit sigma [Paenibacillus sp. CAA11]|uniref:RNA polymerase sigma factor n=1 Tax=Paenibacillus sp. CAA11 TaxID=1532905 RepID=UPI000D34B84F|nr:RNA polymerase sigma factor [Paenibacillus sp. CAA11]AWB43724.1 RNA polymerase subunit sigma [Paenibacillus sp. CAA11]